MNSWLKYTIQWENSTKADWKNKKKRIYLKPGYLALRLKNYIWPKKKALTNIIKMVKLND